MKIVSWRGGELSRRTAETLLNLIIEADGPIVLPLDAEQVRIARNLANNPREIEKAVKHSLHLCMPDFVMAAFAISKGKQIIPLYTERHKEFGRRYGRGAMILDQLPEHINARAFMRQLAYTAEAEQLLHHLERFKARKPALIVAEDHQAAMFSKLFRVKRILLTRDSWSTKKLVRGISGTLMEKLRGAPRQKPRQKPRRSPRV